MNIVIPVSLKNLAAQFNESGHKLYIVGGYVRNAIMGGGVKTDIDITSSVPPQHLRGTVKGARIVPVSKTLGTCKIITGGSEFEYTPFRTEVYAEGGAHRPVSVSLTSSIQLDSKRRDFTCNALYYDITDNKILDAYGGVKDILSKTLRAVVSPEHVFARDGLRILRMVRFAAQMGFSIEEATFETAKKMVGQLADISPERKNTELLKILDADKKFGVEYAHYTGLKLIGELGAWPYLIPELADGIGVMQNAEFHKYDVYEHTLQTVKFAPPEVRLAALFHDIGKPAAEKQDGNMYKHADIGAAITRNRMGKDGLRFPSQVIAETVRLVRHHMYDLNGTTGIGKLRVFVGRNFDIMEKLIALKHADALGSGMTETPPPLRIEALYKEMSDEHCPVTLSDLEVNGRDIMAAFPEMDPRGIGELLHDLLREVMMNPKMNRLDWLLPRAAAILKEKEREKAAAATETTSVNISESDVESEPV